MARRILTLAAAGVLSIGLTATPAVAGKPVQHDEQIEYHRISSYRDWAQGTSQGAFAIPGLRTGVTMGVAAGTTDYTDPHTGVTAAYEYSTWTSPVHDIGFGATEAVASWNAVTPAGTFIKVELHGTYTNGEQTPWYTMGIWASGDGDIRRTSVDDQGDPYSTIWTDTFSIDDASRGVLLSDYQLRLTLYKKPGQVQRPRVWELGAMASNVPDRFTVPLSTGHIAWGKELAVPTYSQNIHSGEYPEYDGGGEAWCSPTSTQMVVSYYGYTPDTSWVNPAYADPQVDAAARGTYDSQYEGAGNWPFNTAYAASFVGLDAIVTRMHSLDEVETFIKHGIPVVVSLSFLASELDGSNYSTSGHLFVIVGFTATGDVVVNDPASSSDDVVRNVYKRDQLETVWQRTKRVRANGTVGSGSGGIAYLITPWWKPLPQVPGSSNW
ncbi:peptidase C39 family protein [Hamadaea sp. NPDC051192]|uniref:peptidase C39 family protein n=1 Tax=Hamadaea sp. NPDC051192 TaxID=3154940 RepID=UPI00342C0AC2